ncbi:arginine--tRNA ligase [Alphaproteobacteria bacterium]|nr:arginine--tRNA ligase [Alphaproteobacteria bacterium]
MNLFAHFQQSLLNELNKLQSSGELSADVSFDRVTVEPPRDASHGDVATNAAMVLAKLAGWKPRDLAEKLAAAIQEWPEVASVDVAGPGFINMTLNKDFWVSQVGAILSQGRDYGNSTIGGNTKINVEYVSANPTGPLHIAHARGAVIGDALANLLAKAGYDVTKEYYINDAGSQIDTLARSSYLRYREAFGEEITIPEGFYPGDYLVAVGENLKARDGDKWMNAEEADWLPVVREFASDAMVVQIKEDLAQLDIMQIFSSEKALVKSGAVERAFKMMDEKGVMYRGVLEPPKGKTPEDWEPREQWLFKATDFGDDVDRPVQKSDGSWTYFANDVAYHFDKHERGFVEMVDIFGVDHGGYVKRMKASVQAMTSVEGSLDILLCNLVKLSRGGEQVKMSKRSGNFITLREVVEEVGKDIVRFLMLTRKPDAPLDFDLDLVIQSSPDNPVWYLHYANARIEALFKMTRDLLPDLEINDKDLLGADLGLLGESEELNLIKQLTAWPRVVESSAKAREPHRIAFYLNDVSAAFQRWYSTGNKNAALRVVVQGDKDLTTARLALAKATAHVIASGLAIMGVEPLKEMR